MFFANLSLVEFLALLVAAAGLTVALYLLSRARRRVVVSTLRFWESARQAVRRTRRRLIDEPWSLLFQLLALLCLLLAVAQPRLGSPETAGRDHVLILDTSAWMGARAQKGTLEQEAQTEALRWLSNLPAEDRVMVIHAGTLATPATPFESSRKAVEGAIRRAEPGGGALDLEQAFQLAVQAQRLQARRAGEIVYVGAGRVSEVRPETIAPPPNLRVLALPPVTANCGITQVVLRRSATDPAVWQGFASIRNDSSSARALPLVVAMGGAVVGNRTVQVPAAGETSTTFEVSTRAAGWLEVRLLVRDALAADDRVVMELPAQPAFRVNVYSAEPDLLRPLFLADPRVEARFLAPAQYEAAPDADLVVIDRFAPSTPPRKAALWIAPPEDSSPIPARRVTGDITLERWNASHPLGAGLRSRGLKLASALVMRTGPGDVAVAECAQGALIAARESTTKAVVFGVHPMLTPLRYELAAPLLAANVFRWLAPEVFVRREVLAGTPGSISVDLGETLDPSSVRVLDSSGRALPFTLDGRTMRFFSPEADTVRVLARGTERVFSLSLPGLGEGQWEPPSSVRLGAGRRVASAPEARDLWPWLAIVGAVLLALEWWVWGRPHARNTRRRVWMPVLKAASIVAALAALFQPAVPVHETKLAVAVLADTSASLSPEDLARESSLVESVERARGRHQVFVYPFARALRAPAPAESGRSWHLARTAGEGGRATDLEAAVREAIAVMPAGLVPRLVLISDGRETVGSIARAAHQARQLGIPIDTYALAGRKEPKLKLVALRLPAVAFTGERVPIELTVDSPQDASATLEIFGEGRTLGASTLSLVRGENQLRVTASIVTPGAIDLSGVLRAAGLGELRFEQALALRRPRLLYLSMDPPGMESHLFQTLASAQFQLDSSTAPRTRFEDYQIVLLNNYDYEALPDARKEELERFVQGGGGLLVIGGERNIYVDKRNRPPNPIERALPATVAPPRSPEGTSVILIIDKSSSMEGRKSELARLAAIGVVENLRQIDWVGVLIFDNSHQWAVPLRRAEDRTMIKRLIAGITPDGGTQIAPALAEAYRRMLSAPGAYKHIVLLTDGISEEGDSLSVSKQAAEKRITISTVGLGQDVNRTYLEKIAQLARGKAYFLTDPSGLEQILLKDVQEHTGSTTVEQPIQVKVVHQAELLQGIDLEHAPALKGYVRFRAKPDAETLLAVPSLEEKDDPLLVRWQYGLGRAAVFASDAKPRWAEGWVGWKGFDRFWANVLRDLLPHAQSGEATLTYDAAGGRLVAEYRFNAQVPVPAKLPALYALGPGGFQRPVELEKAGDRFYRATVPIGARQGLFRLRPLEDTPAFPETGIYLPEAELSLYGNNPLLLRQVAAYTGGHFQPAPRAVFSSTGRTVPAVLRLWPALLAVALLLNLAELAWRKLRRGRPGHFDRLWKNPAPELS